MRALLVVVGLCISACAPSTGFLQSTDFLQVERRSCGVGQTNHCLAKAGEFDCVCVVDDPAYEHYRRNLAMQQRSFHRHSARH